MSKKIVGIAVLAIVLFTVWYLIAANYDYGALSGQYVFRGDGEICVLSLHSDGTFLQEVDRSGKTSLAHGSWRRIGEAGVAFSSQFVGIPGEELDKSGEVYGEFEKTLGIFPKLVLAPYPHGPTFHRR